MTGACSSFREAVRTCSDLKYRKGMQAIKLPRSEKSKIKPDKPRSLTGSVDIDSDLKQEYHQDSRWDNAVGYKCADGVERVYFIEFHPAETSEIECVQKKLAALKSWASKYAKDLWNITIPQEIHWITTGNNDVRLSDKEIRKLASRGMVFPKKYLWLK